MSIVPKRSPISATAELMSQIRFNEFAYSRPKWTFLGDMIP